MLEILKIVEEDIPGILASSDDWKSIYVDYEHPHVERVWREYTINDIQYRIYLHRIHPPEGKALYHPHPWPSAITVLDGSYETGIGYGHNSNNPPPIATKMIIGPGVRYEMIEPSGWHYVAPIGSPAVTLMVTGPPYEKSTLIKAPPVNKEMYLLSEENEQWLLNYFKDAYGTTIH